MLRNTIAVCVLFRADLPRRLDAVQHRHANVHDHDVRQMLLRERDGVPAIGRLRHHLKASWLSSSIRRPFRTIV